MRIGQGFDAHRLVAGRPLWLGGIEIPHARGLEGHSDGDVLLHAVASALLGALGARVHVVIGDSDNAKITDPEDLAAAERVLEARR